MFNITDVKYNILKHRLAEAEQDLVGVLSFGYFIAGTLG